MNETLGHSTHEQKPANEPQERDITMEYDPNHEINVTLREIQERTMREIEAIYGTDVAKRCEATEDWDGWTEVLASEDIVGTFKQKYAKFIDARIAELESSANDEDTKLAA